MDSETNETTHEIVNRAVEWVSTGSDGIELQSTVSEEGAVSETTQRHDGPPSQDWLHEGCGPHKERCKQTQQKVVLCARSEPDRESKVLEKSPLAKHINLLAQFPLLVWSTCVLYFLKEQVGVFGSDNDKLEVKYNS
jgi:hypothetical protein